MSKMDKKNAEFLRNGNMATGARLSIQNHNGQGPEVTGLAVSLKKLRQ